MLEQHYITKIKAVWLQKHHVKSISIHQCLTFWIMNEWTIFYQNKEQHTHTHGKIQGALAPSAGHQHQWRIDFPWKPCVFLWPAGIVTRAITIQWRVCVGSLVVKLIILYTKMKSFTFMTLSWQRWMVLQSPSVPWASRLWWRICSNVYTALSICCWWTRKSNNQNVCKRTFHIHLDSIVIIHTEVQTFTSKEKFYSEKVLN